MSAKLSRVDTEWQMRHVQKIKKREYAYTLRINNLILTLALHMKCKQCMKYICVCVCFHALYILSQNVVEVTVPISSDQHFPFVMGPEICFLSLLFFTLFQPYLKDILSFHHTLFIILTYETCNINSTFF